MVNKFSLVQIKIGQAINYLIASMLSIGIIVSVLAFFDLYLPFLSWLLLVPIFFVLYLLFKSFDKFEYLNLYQQTLIVFLIIVWLSHLLQVFVPETGFDALWYHLPVIKTIVAAKGLVFSPDLYQTLNPLFSDLIFGLGFMVLAESGAKIVAYLFGLSLALASYNLARQFLNKTSSLLVVFLISTFQVISWQSASFYIDVAKAFWEIASLTSLFNYFNLLKSDRKKAELALFFSALLLSASIASKSFSIVLLLPFLFFILMRKRFLDAIFFLIVSLLLPFLFYYHSYLQTGDFFYVFNTIGSNLLEVTGYSSLVDYFSKRTLSLIISPVVLIFSSDYISIGLALLLPLLLFRIKKVINQDHLLILLIFSFFQWMLWWYLPPLSTRYAISGFITLAILIVAQIKLFKLSQLRRIVISLLIVSIWFNMLPRFYVNARSLRYILGFENKEQYIEHFYDGWTDNVLDSWYKIDQ